MSSTVSGSTIVQVAVIQRLDDEYKHSARFSLIEKCHWVLGLAGREDNYRPLHQQIMNGRKITRSDDPGFHLTWWDDEIFLKPLPTDLTKQDIDNFSPKFATDPTHVHTSKTFGLLYSYTRLIESEVDLSLAVAEKLLPDELTVNHAGLTNSRTRFNEWLLFEKAILDKCKLLPRCKKRQSIKAWIRGGLLHGHWHSEGPMKRVDTRQRDETARPNLHWRFDSGDLRIRRLNYILSILTPGGKNFFRLLHHNNDWLNEFTRWAIVAFAYMTVILTSMQVILAQNAMNVDPTWFQTGCLYFAYMTVCFALFMLFCVVVYFGFYALTQTVGFFSGRLTKGRSHP